MVPLRLRQAVPHAIKEPVVNLFSRQSVAAPPAAQEPHALERPHLPRAEFDAIWQEAFGSRTDAARAYFDLHRQRHYELFNAVVHFFGRDPAIDVLEIGPSEYALFYKRLFPKIRFATLDRPLSMHGADAAWSRRVANADRHYNANLDHDVLSPGWGEPALGTFDLVVCTEVIEHLVLHPSDLLEALLSLLKPGGLLYLTTPNFLRDENLARIARHENPQAVYPRRGQNWDAHHHFREMTMAELHAFTEAAGGRVTTSYFSACWDPQPPARVEGRGNLVAVITRKG